MYYDRFEDMNITFLFLKIKNRQNEISKIVKKKKSTDGMSESPIIENHDLQKLP